MDACSNFLDNVKRVAKTIQGALPIIGLVSRLTADEGGFDDLVRISKSCRPRHRPSISSAHNANLRFDHVRCMCRHILSTAGR